MPLVEEKGLQGLRGYFVGSEFSLELRYVYGGDLEGDPGGEFLAGGDLVDILRTRVNVVEVELRHLPAAAVVPAAVPARLLAADTPAKLELF